MKQRITPQWLLLAVCVLLLLVTADQHAGAANPSRSFFSGNAQIDGPMDLDLQISPPVSTPGDVLTLVLTLTNNDIDRASPEVIVTLPRSLRVDMTALPPGASFNVATHTLNWLPLVAADGGRQELRLSLPVETADLIEPEQQVTAVLAHKTEEQTATADFWIGVEPEVSISLSTAQAAVGQPVQLTANVSGPGPLTQEWDLGDGREVAVANPVIVYPVVGTYRVALRATNPLATATGMALITVIPRPAAHFAVDDATPGVNQIIAFTSESGGQRPLRYTWNFGDGTTDSVANPYHLYREPGEYTVRLLVENDAGQSETSQLVQVGLPPETAELVLSDSATSGEPIYGQVSGDAGITAYRWNMGDGHSYEGDQVSHSYAVPGTYWVVASASNEFGSLDVGRWIRVRPGLNTINVFLPVMPYTNLPPPEQSGTIPAATGLLDEPMIELAEPLVLEKMPFPDGATAVEQLFWYINEARRLHNVPPLTYSESLSRAAQQHTDDMAASRFTGHVGSDGSSPPGRLVANGYQGGYGGEATYWGMDNPRHAVEFWVNSPPHRRIILGQAVSEVGVAFTAEFNAPNVWYWTAEFGSPYLPAIVLTPTLIPSPTPTLTPTATLEPTLLPSVTPTAVTPTPLATATATATPTSTPLPTHTPLPLVTPTATPEQ